MSIDLKITRLEKNLCRAFAVAMLILILGSCDQAAETASEPAAKDSAPGSTLSPTTPTDSSATRSSAGSEQNALRAALRIPDPIVRIERVARYLNHAGREQLADVKAAFEEAVLDGGDSEYALFAAWWARFDPRRAYKYTLGEEIRAEHPRMRIAVARSWAGMDGLAAVESGLFYEYERGGIDSPDRAFSSEILEAIVVGWFESGKPGLEEFLGGLSEISNVTQGMRAYARMRVIRDGARETLEWTREPSEFPRAHHRLLLAGALTIIAHQDPALALEWLPIAEADGIDTRTFPMRIAGSWAHHDPEAAFDWIRSLPDPKEQDRAARRAGMRWRESDSRGLANWLSEHVGDPWLDKLRFLTIRTDVYRSDYQVDWLDVLERSQEIADEVRRKNQVIWVLQQWNFIDPAAADAWIEERRDQFTENEIMRAHEISMAEKKKIERILSERARRES